MPRLVLSVAATTIGLAFWWALTEPLPVAPPVLLAVPAITLLCSGVIAGRLGVVAAPTGLAFSLLLGGILSTQLHRAFDATYPAVAGFGGGLAIELPGLLVPLAVASVLGAVGGLAGERLAGPRGPA